MDHLKKMTTDIGMIQFCKISDPDLESGYTIDDNARALIAICKYYQLAGNQSDIEYMKIYLNFIERCQMPDGNFINYVDKNNVIETRNSNENLEDSNGRAIWALGYFLRLPLSNEHASLINQAIDCLKKAVKNAEKFNSPRAIAFSIKGFYYWNSVQPSLTVRDSIKVLSTKIQSMYTSVSTPEWNWFENKLTYANSILPEALLLTSLITGEEKAKEIALQSMNFLIDKMFVDGQFKIISNVGWHEKGVIPNSYGEQPIEACYMMHTLDLFYKTIGNTEYKVYMKKAFDWFLGRNHLGHIMYNPITGGCYDGLEENNVNLNQGAESTVCYLSARLLIESYTSKGKISALSNAVKIDKFKIPLSNFAEISNKSNREINSKVKNKVQF